MLDRTTMIEDRQLPNAALRLLLVSVQEVMGEHGLKAVLNEARLPQYIDNFPQNNLEYGVTFSGYGRLEQAIEDLYGPRGARAMLQRVGRATFQAALKGQTGVLGFAGQAFKSMPLMPLQAKTRLLLQQMVAVANKTVNQPARLEEDAEGFTVVVDWCTCQYRPPHTQPCCLVTLGAFAEGMRWLTEKQFDVQEITCINIGADACRYRIPSSFFPNPL